MRRYDVLMITDCRLPGGTVASIAEEVQAQGRAGLRTGILHVPSGLVADPRPFNPRLTALVRAGAADIVVDPARVDAGLAVLRHPAVFAAPSGALPAVAVDRTLAVVNQSPQDAGGEPYYDLAAFRRAVEGHFGGEVSYAPIGPDVRRQLTGIAPELPLLRRDWVNVIDIDAWAVDPGRRFAGRRPIIGRHSRDDPKKWPATREDVLAAYPAHRAVEVRVLGGADDARRLLGRVPANWTLYPFGSMDPQRFLATIDAWVYFHHPSWVEAFGRTILEAMASGVPSILPPHFAPLFGDAPAYLRPAGVLDQVLAWRDDPHAARRRAAAGQHDVRERFSHQTHVTRLQELLAGTRADPPSAVLPPPREGSTSASTRRRVIFMSSNGSGVGHLMRLMAMARRASPEVEPVFLTLSQALRVVRENGFYAEYLMSRSYADLGHEDWHELLRARLAELIRITDAQAIVFDGTWPYRGLLDALADHPQVRSVWSRRGMWRRDLEAPQLEHAGAFDLVLEPGEFAAAADRGPTAARRREACRIAPITFLDQHELLDRDAARRELGIDPGRTTALVLLGAGNINDVGPLSSAITERLAADGVQICMTRSVIAEQLHAATPGLLTLEGIYPLARYFRAFDMAIAASGYNSYHELLASGIPTLFVPNVDTAVDDQAARSRYAAEVGVALQLPDADPQEVGAALDRLLDPQEREQLAGSARRRYPGNGAHDAMRAIEHLLDTTSAAPASSGPTGDREAPDGLAPTPGADDAAASGRTRNRTLRDGVGSLAARVKRAAARLARDPRLRGALRRPFRALPAPARHAIRRRIRRFEALTARAGPGRGGCPVPPGRLLPPEERHGLAGVAVLLSEELTVAERLAAIDRVSQLHVARRSFAPLLLTFDDDLQPYRQTGMAVELLPSRASWELLHPSDTWPDGIRARLEHLRSVYALDRFVVVGPIDRDLTPMEVLDLTLSPR
jgi:UDP:flavonoid glycosyltransferase YjiC (YdhE family)